MEARRRAERVEGRGRDDGWLAHPVLRTESAAQLGMLCHVPLGQRQARVLHRAGVVLGWSDFHFKGVKGR